MVFSSCEDFLDKSPASSLPVEEAITNMTDLRNAVNGIAYIVSEGRMTYSADFAIYADLKGSDFYPVSNNNQAGPIARYTIQAKDAEADYAYYYFYKAIANVNKILTTIDNVPHSESEQAEFDDYKGQLYAWRALLHFDLARYFCQIPTAASDINAANSGLVLSTEVYLPSYVGTRSTLKQTYDQIIADFNTSLTLLSKDKNDGYLNYWSALALRSRAYLYYGQNDLALADAEDVIECDLYKLYTLENYEEVWGKEFTSESLFELRTTTTYNAQRNAVGYYCDGEGYGECAFLETGALYQYLSTNPTDIRSKLVKDQKGTNPSTGKAYANPAIYPAKYPGREGSLYVNNPKIIRLSEVYLIAAEAALKEGGNAVQYINTLKKNRISDYVDVNSVTLDEILFERRVELFAENSMAFDYWRNKKSINNYTVNEVKYDDYRTILPIPKSEIDLAGGKLVQNPRY